MGVCVVCNVQYKNSVNLHAFVFYDYRMKSHQIHPVALTGTEGISTTLIYNLMSNNTMRDAAKQRDAVQASSVFKTLFARIFSRYR